MFTFIVYSSIKYHFIIWFKIQQYNLAVSIYLFKERVSVSSEFV